MKPTLLILLLTTALALSQVTLVTNEGKTNVLQSAKIISILGDEIEITISNGPPQFFIGKLVDEKVTATPPKPNPYLEQQKKIEKMTVDAEKNKMVMRKRSLESTLEHLDKQILETEERLKKAEQNAPASGPREFYEMNLKRFRTQLEQLHKSKSDTITELNELAKKGVK